MGIRKTFSPKHYMNKSEFMHSFGNKNAGVLKDKNYFLGIFLKSY